MTIEAAGFIVADNEGVIHGTGDTVDAAWGATRETMRLAGIELLADDEDTTDRQGSWTRESALRAWPASQELIDDVDAKGGAVAWSKFQGIACRQSEIDWEHDHRDEA